MVYTYSVYMHTDVHNISNTGVDEWVQGKATREGSITTHNHYLNFKSTFNWN